MALPGEDEAGSPGPTSADEPGNGHAHGVGPADLSDLLGPDYHRKLAGWGGRDYSDPTLIAGHLRSSYLLYLMVLGIAAVADIGAFYPVVALVLRTETVPQVYVVVVGFAAMALSLAHFCGMLSRDCRAGAAQVSKIIPYLCFIVWLCLGAAAFYVRLDLLAGTVSLSFGAAPTSAGLSAALPPAIIFLAFYLATGLVAGVGAYLWRNPLLAGYASARRAYIESDRRAEISSSRTDSAKAGVSALRAELSAAEKTLEREIESRRALAEKLKLTAGYGGRG